MEIKIEKNIPISKGNRRSKGKWQKLFSILEIGDSFLVKNKHVRQAIYTARPENIGITSRSNEDGTIRIWRTI